MVWFKVDDGLPLNKRVLSIPRRERMSAMGLWVMAGAWVAKELNDGVFPDYMLEELGGTQEQASALVKAGMWEEKQGGWFYPAWGEFQPTKEQVEAGREKEANRKATWRAAKAKKEAREQATEMSRRDTSGTDGGTEPSVPTLSPLPVPSRPDPTRPDTPTLSQSSHLSNRASGPDSTDLQVDVPSLVKNIELACDIEVTEDEALAWAGHVLTKAKRNVKNRDAYLTSSIRGEETYEWFRQHRK